MWEVSDEVGEVDGVVNERNVVERYRHFDLKVTSYPRHLLLREEKQQKIAWPEWVYFTFLAWEKRPGHEVVLDPQLSS